MGSHWHWGLSGMGAVSRINHYSLSIFEGKGCILELGLQYADELHDFHNDYPLARENIKKVHKVHKLVPNLNNKKKYKCIGPHTQRPKHSWL